MIGTGYDGSTSSCPGAIVVEVSPLRSRSFHTPSRGSPAKVRDAIDHSVSPGWTRYVPSGSAGAGLAREQRPEEEDGEGEEEDAQEERLNEHLFVS